MIAVLDYGIGNLASARKALSYLGADARLVTDVAQATGANGVVLPGVGAFGPCVQALRASGLDRAVLNALDSGTPFLGICVGMQMLYEDSEESPGFEGLGVFPGSVRRLKGDVKIPQMQWNQVDLIEGRSCSLLPGHSDISDSDSDISHSDISDPDGGAGNGSTGWYYFNHSFAPEVTDDTVGVCEYGGELAAISGSGVTWATQFHPEKSSSDGLSLLSAFVSLAMGGSTSDNPSHTINSTHLNPR